MSQVLVLGLNVLVVSVQTHLLVVLLRGASVGQERQEETQVNIGQPRIPHTIREPSEESAILYIDHDNHEPVHACSVHVSPPFREIYKKEVQVDKTALHNATMVSPSAEETISSQYHVPQTVCPVHVIHPSEEV